MIREGDIFKMGRITIKVRELAIDDKACMNNDGIVVLSEKQKELNDKTETKSISETLCRICFRTEDTIEDPLFSPCKCAGSMEYIHFSCLKEWLKNKLVSKETSHSYSFLLRNLECELCKTPLQGTRRSARKVHLPRQVLQLPPLSQVRTALHDLRHPAQRVQENQRCLSAQTQLQAHHQHRPWQQQ
jgi:hypothetical protein